MLGLLVVLSTQNARALPIIPIPNRVEIVASKPFVFNEKTVISTDRKMFAITELRAAFPKSKLKYSVGKIRNVVRFSQEKGLGEEGYTLRIDKDYIQISYQTPSGALYAIETLKQMRTANSVPAVKISDSPRFRWRGMHLDVSRHFFPVSTIKRQLDLMKAVKMNVFHWHLVDDGGWRIEIKKYPKLTRVGAWRRGTGVPWSYSDINLEEPKKGEQSYGGFYTQEEIKDVVKYAMERGISVVPEIEMPGHTLPVLVGYPELACQNATKYEGNSWTTNVYCAGKETSFKFIENVLDEVVKLFPAKWVHIGGDEVDKKWWDACPDCRNRMKNERLNDAHELQSYFVKRVEKYIIAKGKRMIGWDEILEGGLAPNATVMSWRGISGGVAAAKSGHEVVMSPTSHCYFDFGYDVTSTEKVYGWDPIPSVLTQAERRLVIGGQCNLWTEWIPDQEKLDRMTWPRAFAMAEVLWTKREKNWDDFQTRMISKLSALDSKKVAYYLEEPRIPYAFAFDRQPMMLHRSDFAMPIYMSSKMDAPAKEWRMMIDQQLPFNQAMYAAYKRSDGSLGDIAELYQSPTVYDAPAVMPENGLEVLIWKGKFDKVADFESKPPTSKAKAEAISLDRRPDATEMFGLKFRGRIRFPDRHFRLYLSSDDGSVLKLNGVTVINHDGPHGENTKSSGIRAVDGLYDFELSYFEAGGASSLRLEYESETVTRRPIPASWLYEPK